VKHFGLVGPFGYWWSWKFIWYSISIFHLLFWVNWVKIKFFLKVWPNLQNPINSFLGGSPGWKFPVVSHPNTTSFLTNTSSLKITLPICKSSSF